MDLDVCAMTSLTKREWLWAGLAVVGLTCLLVLAGIGVGHLLQWWKYG